MAKITSSLLTTEEWVICEQISKNSDGLYSQRARVLLALNEGMSQEQVSEQTGLTIGQVKYCLQRFRQLRTASIFSADSGSQVIQTRSEFSSQLINADSKIKDSINQLKQTQDKLNTGNTAVQTDKNCNVTGESASVESINRDSVHQLKQTSNNLSERKVTSQADEYNELTKEPDNKKKAGKKTKIKKPKKKPKKIKNRKAKKPKKQKKKKKHNK